MYKQKCIGTCLITGAQQALGIFWKHKIKNCAWSRQYPDYGFYFAIIIFIFRLFLLLLFFIIILYWGWLIVSPSVFSCCHVLTSLACFIFSFFVFLNGSFFFLNSNAISVWTHITLQLLLFLLTIFYIQGAIKNNYF